MADRDLEVRKALQELARHQMIERLYRDILIDMAVCDIEGWDKTEYIRMIICLLDTLGKRGQEVK